MPPVSPARPPQANVSAVDPDARPDGDALVTVVIPALNASDTLPAQLDALAHQTDADGFEVVVVDNDSTDGTGDVARSHPEAESLGLRVVLETSRGINFARNAGIEAALGDRILLCDADDVVDTGWLAAMIAALTDGVWVAGTQDYTVLNTERTREIWNMGHRSRFVLTEPYSDNTYGCNCGFHRAMWAEVGGFDSRLNGTGGDENEFFMRAHAAGFRPRHVPDALVGYRLRPGIRAMMRQRYRQGKNQVLMRQLAGGRLLPDQFTIGSEVREGTRAFASLPRYVRSSSRRCLWLASVSRHSGRLVELTRAALNRKPTDDAGGLIS